MARMLFKKVFDPKKDKDSSTSLLKIRREVRNRIYSDLGISNAINDARDHEEEILVIKKSHSFQPVISNFSRLRKQKS